VFFGDFVGDYYFDEVGIFVDLCARIVLEVVGFVVF